MWSWALACLFLLPFTVMGHINLGEHKGMEFIESDIIMPKHKKNRNGILRSKRWTNGVLPYEINMKGYTQEHVDAIEEAMRDIEKHTCVKFQKRTTEPNYITIVNGNKCCSNVGMEGGQQWISLANWGCFSHRTVVHELLHSVGLWHEQMRLDRDQYLTIRKENLEDQKVFHNFAMVSGESTSDYSIPYNYASVMHYDAWSFGNGDIVMEPTDESMLAVMGFSDRANETDYEKVRRIYECKGSFPIVPAANDPCEDQWPDCDKHSFQCKRDLTVINSCRKTCGYCRWGGPINAPPRSTCYDLRHNCRDDLLEDPEKCQKPNQKSMMERECDKTCGCSATRPVTPRPRPTQPPQDPSTPKPAQGSCNDLNDQCFMYLSQCDHETVRHWCQKTCKVC